MSVAPTSRDAYSEITRQGKTIPQHRRILELLRRMRHPMTRGEIADYFQRGQAWDGGAPIPLGSVTARVHALIKAGALKESISASTDPRTGYLAKYLEPVYPTPARLVQIGLFDAA